MPSFDIVSDLEMHEIDNALQHGAEDYLLKGTIDQDSLLRSIRYAVERHRGVRDLTRVGEASYDAADARIAATRRC